MKRIHLHGVIWLGFLGCMKEGCASVSTSGMVLLTHRGTHTMELNCSDQLTNPSGVSRLLDSICCSVWGVSLPHTQPRCMLSAGCQQVSAVLCSLTGTLVSSVATWPVTDAETSQTLQSFGVEHSFWWWKPSVSCFPTAIFHRVVFETEGGGQFPLQSVWHGSWACRMFSRPFLWNHLSKPPVSFVERFECDMDFILAQWSNTLSLITFVTYVS